MKKSKVNGFTLIELMIVIVIVGVIMAYAIPSYQRQVIESKRTVAKNGILQIASAEEKLNATFNQYTTVIGGTGTDGNSLGLGAADFMSSPDYNFSVTVAAGTGYTITATAKGKTQINDNYGVNCTSMSLNGLGQKTPLNCWQ